MKGGTRKRGKHGHIILIPLRSAAKEENRKGRIPHQERSGNGSGEGYRGI